VKISITVSV